MNYADACVPGYRANGNLHVSIAIIVTYAFPSRERKTALYNGPAYMINSIW